MKKRFFALFLCLLVALCAITVASAESQAEVGFFAPSESEYVALNSPYLTAVGEKYVVVFDENKFNVIGENKYSVSYTDNFTSAAIHGDTLYATRDNLPIFVYDLKNNAEISIPELISLNARFLALKNDYLYLNEGSSTLVYNISNNALSLESTENYSGEFFAVNDNGQIIRYQSLSGKKYISILNGTQKEIISEFNEIAVCQSEAFTFSSSDNNCIINVYDALTLDFKRTHSLSGYSSFTACGDKLYLTSISESCVDVYKIGESLEYLYTYCSSGNKNGRFNEPSAIFASGNYVSIADKNNNRIQRFLTSGELIKTISLDSKPTDIVEFNEKSYIITDNKIRMTTGGASTIYDKADGVNFTSLKSLAVDCFGTVYAIDEGRIVYKADGESYFKAFASVSPISLAVSPKGSVLYAVYATSISAYDSLGKIIFTTNISEMNLSSSAKAVNDVNGNMFVLDGSKIIKLSRSLAGYTYDKEINLCLNGAPIEFSDLSISTDGKAYLTGKTEHRIFTLDKSVTGASVYDSSEFVPPIDAYDPTPLSLPLNFVKVNQGGSFVYDFSQSYENTRVISENTYLYLLHNESVNGFYYVYYSGKVGFIPTSSVTPVSQDAFTQYDAFALLTTEIYKYPVKENAFKLGELIKGTPFKVVGNASGYTTLDSNGKDIKWSEILYDGKIYYIERTKIALPNLERPTDYGYAKLRASSVGKKVCVYALPDEASAILGEYTDGTEVKLLTEIDEASTFTEIKIGDTVGYVKTQELTTSGLTTAQLVILILVLLGGAASLTILVVSRKMHRKSY